MTQIPVRATISQAYRFAFGNFLTNLGQIWVPFAIISGFSYILRPYMTAYFQAINNHDFSGIGHFIYIFFLLYLIECFLLTMQIVALTKEALGLRTGPAWYNFSLGKAVWRLSGAMILIVVIFFLAALIAGLGIGLGFLLAKLIHFAFLGVIVTIVIYGAMIYGTVRLTFLLAPSVVAEERINLTHAWNLTRGNFWRIFAVGLAILVPIVAVEAIFIFGFLMHGMPSTMAYGTSPDQQAAAAHQMSAWVAANQERVAHYWYIIYPVSGIMAVVFYGLGAGAQCFAYRALVASESPGRGTA